MERKEYIPVEPVLAELKEALAEGLEADYITLAGSGEPTLNSRLGELIDGIKKLTDIPVAILTNGTLLYRKDVRADCLKADVVMPSLDAGDEQTFQKINRPNGIISIEKLISGLCTFRKEYSGQIWLEVFFIEGINTDAEHFDKIKKTIEMIDPDKVHLNTAVRPAAVSHVRKLKAQRLQEIARRLGPKCEVVADFSAANSCRLKSVISEDTLVSKSVTSGKAESLLSMLKRRPCSINDICTGLGVTQDEAQKHISEFQNLGLIKSEEIDGIVFYKTIS
jgi:wyosine [tRNA(Phe)-imidazoG37] synthetase (radical SAM superfamily)